MTFFISKLSTPAKNFYNSATNIFKQWYDYTAQLKCTISGATTEYWGQATGTITSTNFVTVYEGRVHWDDPAIIYARQFKNGYLDSDTIQDGCYQ